MSEDEPNLRKLEPSRKKVRAGDVFVMLPPDAKGYLFGRVIDTEADAGGFGPAVLLYIYRARSADNEPPMSELTPDNLLLPPMMTNRLGWRHGYFQTITHQDLRREDVLAQHCFKSHARGQYYDERGHQVLGPIEPVGDWALHSYRSIDDAISEVLGIPLASGLA